LPFGVITFQQFPFPYVGRLWLTAVSEPFELIVYDEMLDVSLPLLGSFSEMTSCPLGVNAVAKTPGVTLLLLATAPRVPSG